MRLSAFISASCNILLITAVFTAVPTCGKSRAPGPPASAGKPNILFCIADDMSFLHLNVYRKTPWLQTPVLDRIARDGVLFTNAYTPNSKCAPSRSCILTGRNPWQLEAAANHVPFFPDKFVTWMEILPDHGYRTGYTGKGWAPGKTGQRNGAPRMLTGLAYNQHRATAPTPDISNIDYPENFRAFLNEKPEGQPFCFWFGGLEPHRRYTYGSGVRLGKKKTSDIPEVPPYWPDNETVRNDMLDYAFEVEYFDSRLGKILEILEQSGQLENTLVIVTSDNGMPFPRVKGNVYEFSNHLPLLVMWKGKIVKTGRTIDDFVSFIDFAPTVLEAAGIAQENAGMQKIQGKSLLPLLLAQKEGLIDPSRNQVILGRERTDVGRPGDAGYPVRAIVKDNFLYLVNYEPSRWPAGNPETGYPDTDGSPVKSEILDARRKKGTDPYWDLSFGKRPAEELYRLDTDPYGMNNLAASRQSFPVKKRLRKTLEKELRAQGDPRISGNGKIFDDYPFANEETADFYNRLLNGEKVKAGWINASDYEKPGEIR